MKEEQYTYTVDLGIEKAKKEEGNVSYLCKEGQKKYIYSKYTPMKTAQESIDFLGTNKETIWVVCGIGLGYAIEEILKKAGMQAHILVIEPNQYFVDIQKPYISAILKDKRVSIFSGNDFKRFQILLHKCIRITDADNIKVIQTPIYTEFFEEYYLNVIKVMREYVELIKMNHNTRSHYAEKQIENTWTNKEAIKNSYDLATYKNAYKNIPAVIVSAGPSLSKNIEWLKEFKGVIFTGTRTLPHIMDLGVRPHFLVCVDNTDVVYEIMRDYKENDLNLIAVETANPLVIQHNTGHQYMLVGTNNRLSKEMFDIELPGLPLQGSVSTLCVSSAYFMGCNPIMFIGQDLAYTNQRTHVDTFMNTGKDTIKRYVDGYYGDKVETRSHLIQFLRWFEMFIEQSEQGREYINCTEGGALIKGARNEKFEEMVKKYHKDCSAIQVAERKVCDEQIKEKADKKIEYVIDEISQLQKIVETGVTLSNKLLDEYTTYKGIRVDKINDLVKKIDKSVDSKLKQINHVIDFIFDREYVAINRKQEYKEPYDEKEIDKNIRICRRSIDLYSALNNASMKVLTILNQLNRKDGE